jgi:hypothetical protein
MRLFAAVALVLLLAAPALAAEWGQIKPAVTTQRDVRARYGAPTREIVEKLEGYDSIQWLYEGPQAPTGIVKLIIDFGLLTPAGFRKEVVRTFRLEPKPEIFNRKLVMDGWGTPSRVGTEGDSEFFLYAEGLLVYFGKDKREVTVMIFTPPQPLPPPTAAPPGSPQR